MKKVMTILAIFAMVGFVACQKPSNDNKKDEQKEEEQKPADEYAGPVEGTSEWSLIGALLETSWDKDYVMAVDGDIYVVKNVKLAAADEFKIRKDKAWGDSPNRGGVYAELGKGFAVEHNGPNIKPGLDGIYDIYYNAAKEQMAVCAKDAAPQWADAPAAAKIAVDGDFADWSALEAGTFKKAVNDPDSPWPGVAEIRCYADANYVFYYMKFDEESLQECKDADTPAMHIRLCINTDGEYESGYTSYFLEGYDFIIEGQIMDAGEWVEYDGTLHQRIGGWVELLAPENGLVYGVGKGNEFEISLDRALFNKACDDAVAAGTIDAADKKPMGDEFQTGIRFYCNGWDEFSNMPNSSIEEEAGNGWGYLMRIKTN